MIVTDYMKEHGINLFRAVKETGIPYNTLWCIYIGKTSLRRCSGITLLKLARWMHISMEELVLSEMGEENK